MILTMTERSVTTLNRAYPDSDRLYWRPWYGDGRHPAHEVTVGVGEDLMAEIDHRLRGRSA